MNPTDNENRPRRWYQFGLRTLLVLTALCALAVGAWRTYLEPYHRQRETMALIERLQGSYKTAEAHVWLRRLYGSDFQNLVVIDLADCDDPAAYLDAVAALPKLETLAVGGSAFHDEHLRRVQQITTLRGLVLDGTGVTREGIASLREARPAIELFQSDRRAIRALRSLVSIMDTATGPDMANLRDQVSSALLVQCDRAWFLSTVSDADLAILERLSSLQHLRLPPPITDAGLAYAKDSTALRTLDLFDTQISDAGLAYAEGLNSLRWLGLGFTRIGDSGLVHLKGLSKLNAVDLRGTQVTDAGVANLQRALPSCQIIR